MSEELEHYHQKGGTYVIPVEIMNYWLGEYEHLESVIDKAIDLVNTRLRDVNLHFGIDNEFREEYDELLEILRSKE